MMQKISKYLKSTPTLIVVLTLQEMSISFLFAFMSFKASFFYF